MTKQQELARRRLEAKMKKREEKQQENMFVNSMIQNAQKRGEMMREKTMAAQGGQRDALEV